MLEVKVRRSLRSRLPTVMLGLLGVFLLPSSAQHLVGSPELTAHYVDVGLGPKGALLIGMAQLLAGIGLLVRRTQTVVAFVFAGVMLVALFNHLLRGVSFNTLMPLSLFVWAIFPIVWLRSSLRWDRK